MPGKTNQKEVGGGKKRSHFQLNFHNHPYMCRREIQRQKCVVLSLCLIIVKDKWRIERKYYIFRPISHPLFIMPLHQLTPSFAAIQTKNTSRRNRPQPKNEEIFSTLSLRKTQNHLRPFFALATPHTAEPHPISTQSF